MSSPRIVIVTYNWPPRNAIGTHRPYAWAKYWKEAGAKVTVVTACKQPFDGPLDLELPPIPGVEVIEVPYGGAVSRVGGFLRSGRTRLLAKKVKAWLIKVGKRSMDPRMAWRKAAQPVAQQLAMEADVVVSTYGPAAAHLIGYDMRTANPRLRWVADYRDLWSQSHISELPKKVRLTTRNIELNTVGAYADVLTAVSHDLVDQISSLAQKKAFYVPNGFDIDEELLRRRLTDGAPKPSRPMRIVHTGMIYEGHRDPTPLLDVLSKLYLKGDIDAGDVTIDFYGERVDLAKRLAGRADYAPFIRLMGHVSREKALIAQREAGLLLLLESPAAEARGVLTGKLFEYIAAGRPILCVGSRPEYEIGEILVSTGTGRVFGPDQYRSIEQIFIETLKGKGLYLDYIPVLDEILVYSRKRLAVEMFENLINVGADLPAYDC